jgi:hypothetical protein
VPTIETEITKVHRTGRFAKSGPNAGQEWVQIDVADKTVGYARTADPDRWQEARALEGRGPVEFDYSERDGQMNEHTGRPYKDRYYNRARLKPAATLDDLPSDAPAGGQAREWGYKTPPDDAWRIALSVGSERAVATLPLMPDNQRDPETQQNIALFWARFIYLTPRPEPLAAQLAGGLGDAPAGSNGPGAYEEPDSYELPPPRTDDDIPF